MKTKIHEIFGNPLSVGIFAALENIEDYTVPWQDEIDSAILDVAYNFQFSGLKTASPLVRHFLAANNVEVSGETESKIFAETAVAIYGKRWNKLYATLDLEYNPIENYDMTETRTPATTETVDSYENIDRKTAISADEKTGVNADRKTATEADETTGTNANNTVSVNGKNTGSVYGFDSAIPVPVTENEALATDNITTTEADENDNFTHRTAEEENNFSHETADEENNYSHRTADEESNYTHETADKDNNFSQTKTVMSGTDTLTRHGNIGVTTSQQLIESERNLWAWNFMKNVVFADLDEILTLNIY